MLEGGRNLPFPDGLLINGRGWNGYTFTVDPGAIQFTLELVVQNWLEFALL